MAEQMSRQKQAKGFFFHKPDWIEGMTEIIQMLPIASLFAIPIVLLDNHQEFLISMWLLAGWLLFWLAALTVRHFWQFLAASAAIVLTPVLLPGWIGFELPLLSILLLEAALVILLVRAFIQRIKQNQDKPRSSLVSQLIAVLFFFGLDLGAAFLKLEILVVIYFYVTIFYLLLVIIRWHSQSLKDQLGRFARMPTQPAGRIMKFNRLLLVIFAGFLLILLLVSPWLRLHELIPLLGAQLLLGLRWLVRQLLSLTGERPGETTVPSQTTLPSESQPQLPDAGETPAWLQVLNVIFNYVFIVLAYLILLAGAILLFVWLYRRFSSSRPGGPDTRESLLPGIRDQIRERVFQSTSQIRQRFSMDPDQRIRRIYSRLVEKSARLSSTSLGGLTPRQIADLIGQKNPEIMREITLLYEKARYGDNLCSGADVRHMQLLCKEFK
jgi:hypothetical protein